MPPKLQVFTCTIALLFFTGLASFADEPKFPKLSDFEVISYSTEVMVADVIQQSSVYVIEAYDSVEDAGKMELFIDDQIELVYYDNTTYEILEVTPTSCITWLVDESKYGLEAAFYGWLIKDPLVIGPSALLHYAVGRYDEITYEGIEDARDIPCEKFSLNVVEKDKGDRVIENVTLNYYFAPKDWATPYKKEGLRVPIRITVIGQTSKGVAEGRMIDIELINDFAFFKPYIGGDGNIQPPLGIGCYLRKESSSFPEISTTFQYTAELVDVLYENEKGEVDVKFERVWYDQDAKIGRFDIFKRTTSSATFQDFNTGIMFEYTKEQDCKIKPLKNAFFEKYDDSSMLGEFKDAKEVLNLNGKFYDMGQRVIGRGLNCDVYERVETNYPYKELTLDKFVVTAYFIDDATTVGVNSEIESRIPVLIMLTGWKGGSMVLRTQYNIFAFDDNIWPEMYADFEIEKCYRKSDSKGYFELILLASIKDAAYMEGQDDMVSKEIRKIIAKYANVPEWRIPFLKIDYTPVGIYVSAMMVERPAELAQFYKFGSDDFKTKDKHISMADAKTLEQCASACIDGEDCKGFYFCNRGCFLKSEDPSATHEDKDDETDMGYCDEYLRAVKFTSNIHNTKLNQALKNLDSAVHDKNVTVAFKIPNGLEAIIVAEMVSGGGISTDEGTPYSVNVKYRYLDPSATTSKVFNDVELLHECYKKCQSMTSGCASFSYCGRQSADSRKPMCIVSSEMVIRGKTNDLDLVEDGDCDIYDLKYLEYFNKYPEQITFVSGYKDIKGVGSLEECARQCRLEEKGKCRGFEYCQSLTTCSLHTKHILDLKPNQKTSVSEKNACVHYAAKFIADYSNLGPTLVDDTSNVRYQLNLEECARICSEELGSSCKSFNYCPTGQGSCELSGKVLTDLKVDTISKNECIHYEKRDGIEDWTNTVSKSLSKSGYTSKGFTGLVIGMLALGLILGAIGFVCFSYFKSRRQSGEGASVRFMKQET